MSPASQPVHATVRATARTARPAAVAATIRLAAAYLATVLLAACAGPAEGPQAATDTATQTGSSATAASAELTVLAAASLQEAFEEIGAAVEEDNPGLTLTFDFQGSQDLVASLAQGAPADVLATASTTTMEDAVSQSLVGEPTEFATNVLALIVPEGNPADVTGLDSSLDGADLVVCAPEVPCGEATVRLAEALGVTLDPVSQEQKVTDVRGKVESGEAEAGIVYATDAAAAVGVERLDVPDNGVVNHYPVATTSQTSNPQAAQVFIDAVTGEEGQAVLADYGFGAPGNSSPEEPAGSGESDAPGASASPGDTSSTTASTEASPPAGTSQAAPGTAPPASSESSPAGQ
ncbi:molybdate ABC transporter substrate-binding protein [Actinomyces sp. 2119]|uniref:Molybdate ABC transporter substrate-binding protein n=2 Tax=Actinomyces lilanjuaniae TaxID=2321394 RepID=A0ABN5PUH1_9ACTO|nr:molybdate ABC transporter substrate-binding protein [Actinomyces sp. 2119]AYD90772.1 molybdate ABC transporter substrate-binding protein [Actinomyces lilanjuaniae]RJF43333.1 molybdate ABC transporter substrate-binding protein [Actinomyces sp. 2119]